MYGPPDAVVRVNSFSPVVEEEKLPRISLKKFVNDINHCPDCRNNPAYFLSSKMIPVCMEHWNLIADAPIVWTEEGKIILLKEVQRAPAVSNNPNSFPKGLQ